LIQAKVVFWWIVISRPGGSKKWSSWQRLTLLEKKTLLCKGETILRRSEWTLMVHLQTIRHERWKLERGETSNDCTVFFDFSFSSNLCWSYNSRCHPPFKEGQRWRRTWGLKSYLGGIFALTGQERPFS